MIVDKRTNVECENAEELLACLSRLRAKYCGPSATEVQVNVYGDGCVTLHWNDVEVLPGIVKGEGK